MALPLRSRIAPRSACSVDRCRRAGRRRRRRSCVVDALQLDEPAADDEQQRAHGGEAVTQPAVQGAERGAGPARGPGRPPRRRGDRAAGRAASADVGLRRHAAGPIWVGRTEGLGRAWLGGPRRCRRRDPPPGGFTPPRRSPPAAVRTDHPHVRVVAAGGRSSRASRQRVDGCRSRGGVRLGLGLGRAGVPSRVRRRRLGRQELEAVFDADFEAVAVAFALALAL